jgi:hypothetical protein
MFTKHQITFSLWLRPHSLQYFDFFRAQISQFQVIIQVIDIAANFFLWPKAPHNFDSIRCCVVRDKLAAAADTKDSK